MPRLGGPGLHVVAIVLSTLACAGPVVAQETNLAVFQRLARECLGELPADVDTLALEMPDRMPYLRSALIERWKSDGREVYAAANSPPTAVTLPRLEFSIAEAGVRYTASGRRRLNRDVTLVMYYTLTGPDGRILLDDHCSRTAGDSIRRSDVVRLEDPAFAETQGDAPRARWIRRYVEPALLTAATALGVYLFFTLRSQSADD